ncbi:MAG: uroporphyrinogen decarboxylase family protein [Thermoleophilia bacterium]
MTGAERIVAAVLGDPVDVTPVAPVLLMQGARVLGVPLGRYFGEPGRIAEGQLALLDRFGHDAVFAMPHVVQDVLPWGAGIDLHDDGPPSVNGMVLSSYEDIERVAVPDPTRHPYCRHTLRAAEALARRVKGQQLIVGAVIGPFSLPTMLMGTRKLLSLLLEPEPVRRRFLPTLLEKTTAYASRWASAQLDAGCDLVVVAEGIASATILDEATFLRDARPALERFVARTPGLLALELVGHGLPFLPHLRDLGVAGFLIGESDRVDAARRAIGPGKALIGNVNNLKLLRFEPERVEFEARRVIAAAGPGFVLSNQGPEIPWDVPDASIEALVRAARSSRPARAAA